MSDQGSRQNVVADGASTFRYSVTARRQALMMSAAATICCVVLIAVIVTRWSNLEIWTRVFSLILAAVALATIRSQVARQGFRLRLDAQGAAIEAPLLHRSVPWSLVVEARRMQMPQFGRERKWACTLYVSTPRGTSIPILLFDNQLENAEDAWNQVVRATPQARHRGTSEL